MDKTTLFVVVLVVLLVAGAFMAVASIQEPEEGVNSEEVQPQCNSGTCNQQCSGSCGVPRCGCGR